jgi:hypothetical protein
MVLLHHSRSAPRSKRQLLLPLVDPCSETGDRHRLTPDERARRLAQLRQDLAGTAPWFHARLARLERDGGRP